MAGLTSTLFPLLSSVLVLLAVRTILRRRRNPYGLPYPPGPPSRFLVGNFFDIPKQRPYREYANWSKEYNSKSRHPATS